jgi:tetratricopeptide (TPR) repeat protein
MRALKRSIPLVFSFSLLLPSAATAQSTTTLIQSAQTTATNRYAAESVIIDRDDWIYSSNADGTGYREDTIAATVLTDAAVRQLGVIGIEFASASEHVEIVYAQVRHKDGSVTQTPVTDAIEQPDAVTQQAPFYSDLKQEQLPIKDLQVGDTLEWQARIVRTKPQAPNEFWGSQDFLADTDGVALEESIELRVPAASAATVWTNPRSGVKPVETMDGTTKVYVWKSAQLNPTAGPEADAAKKAKKGKLLTPDEETDVEEGKLPAVAWTSFKSWADVGAWYRGLEGTRTVPNDDIKAKVASLTAGKTTEEDKVRAVYSYVSSQIHYIGVAFGIGRYQPHEADDVLQNQYGDCKDKATLLASMLEVLGLHPDSVLIGAGVRMNDAVPSPASFNHLITRVQVDGKEVWLDATTEIAPYQVLVFQLRDKLALVVPEQGTATLERTPKSLPFPSVDTWKAEGALNKDGVSESHITLTLRGDDELVFRSAAHEVSPGQYNDLVQRIVASFGYGGTVSNASFTRPEDTANPFVMIFDYHREKAGDWDNLRTIAQLMPVNLPTFDGTDPPAATIMLGAPHTEISQAAMKLPEGWTAELPEAQHDDSVWATYDVTYRFEKGTVYTERKLVILQRKMAASDWKAYKKWTDEVGMGEDPYIQLRRGAEQKPPASLPPPSNGSAATTKRETVEDANASATDLLAKANKAMQLMDPDTAEALLKRVEAKDPKTAYLWSDYAKIALLRGAPNEAIEDCQRELGLHSEETEVYRILLSAEATHGNMTGAVETLHAWAVADAENWQPEAVLAQILSQQKKYAEAAEAGSKALSLMGPEMAAKNEKLQAVTGVAQIKAGMTVKGEATLLAVLKATDDPGLMNNAAYGLADAGLDLPLDDQTIRAALIKMDAETSTWTLDEAPGLLKAKSSILVATWDTMGWVLFREGKLNEAKNYIEASVLNNPNKEVEGHLAEVNKALGITEAKMARKLPEADITVTASAPESEQIARTLDLGPSNGVTGYVEYKLLLSQRGIERAEPAGEKTLPGAQEMLKKLDFSKYFPAESTAKLAWFGFMNCYNKRCALVLEP